MRLLFSFVGGRGHLEPLLPVAAAARAAGHEVVVAGKHSVVATLGDYEVRTVGAENDAAQTDRTPLAHVDARREERLVRDMVAGRNTRDRVTQLLDICAARRPDAIVCDEVDFAAMVVAERLGIPHATVLVTAAGTFIRGDVLGEAVDELRRENGLPADPAFEMLGRRLVLSPFPPSFRSSPLPPTARGLRLYDPPSNGGRRTIVYFTLGTIFDLESGDLFERALAGLGLLPYDVVATIGRRLDPAAFGPLPANVTVAQYIPQRALLPRCSTVLCHGGSGSLLGALAHGLPLVVLPLGADQPHNAARCAATGVGLVLDAETATAGEIASAVQRVLDEEGFRRAAEGMRDELARMPGPEQAVQAVTVIAA